MNQRKNNFRPNPNFGYYLYWIIERQNIFWRKFLNGVQPYTEDDILKSFKFTNVYRVLDRSSQYLLQNVIYNGKIYSKEDMFLRILIYKHFNLPSTWDKIIVEFGDIDLNTDWGKLFKFLRKLKEYNTIYSNAYMLTSQFTVNKIYVDKYGFNSKFKFENYIKLFLKEFYEFDKINQVLNCDKMSDSLKVLNSIISFGDFISYQYIQDFNYTDFLNQDINEICLAGPGTIRGIQRTFDIEGQCDFSNIVKWVHSNFEQLLQEYGLLDQFISLPNKMPEVPDLSNCFCEVDKYLRGAGIVTEGKIIHGNRIKNSFKQNNKNIEFIFPPKWNIPELKIN